MRSGDDGIFKFRHDGYHAQFFMKPLKTDTVSDRYVN